MGGRGRKCDRTDRCASKLEGENYFTRVGEQESVSYATGKGVKDTNPNEKKFTLQYYLTLAKQLEARDRLEIKVGDGGAVEMIQNGKDRVKLGKPGRLAKKIFLKVPNPYDNTQFIIKELGE